MILFLLLIKHQLTNIYFNLNIIHGYLDEELPEQKMITRYLTGNNIGRN
jgi:hypothetical protein